MSSMRNWMLGAAVVAGAVGLGADPGPGSRVWDLCARAGGLCSSVPGAGILLDSRLHGQWLLDPRTVELRRRPRRGPL